MKTDSKKDDKLKFIIEYRKQLYNFSNQYDYDWFCSLNLPNYKVEDAEKFLKIWRCNLSVKDHIRIAYLGVIVTSQFTGPHIHLLMFGKNNRGETLLDRDKKNWQNEWARITGRDAVIEDYYRDSFFVRYISGPKNTPINHFEPVIPYNDEFLKKYRKNN